MIVINLFGEKFKVCRTCKKEKPLNTLYFREDPVHSTGYKATCVECEHEKYVLKYKKIKG